MNRTNLELASLIRRMTEVDVLPGSAESVLEAYQQRADTVNKRLSLASDWLRHGLLAEALAHVREHPDALDAVCDLELGRDAQQKLLRMCQEQGVEYPSGIDQQAAWELSHAHLLKQPAGEADSAWETINRYRSACLSSASIWERLLTLRDACVAIARDKASLGPVGDAIEQTLVRQTRPLIALCIGELTQTAAIASRKPYGSKTPEESAPASKTKSKPRDPKSEFNTRYVILVQVIESLNASQAQLVLDFKSNDQMIVLARKQDELRLKTSLQKLLQSLAALDARGPDGPGRTERSAAIIEDLRKRLRSADDVLARKLVTLLNVCPLHLESPVPSPPGGAVLGAQDIKGLMAEAHRVVRESDDLRNEIKGSQRQLWEMIELGEGTPRELMALYRRASEGGLTIPDDLNEAFHQRLAVTKREQRRRRQRSATRTGVIGVAILATITVAVNFGLASRSQHLRLVNRAKEVTRLLDDGEVREAYERFYTPFQDKAQSATQPPAPGLPTTPGVSMGAQAPTPLAGVDVKPRTRTDSKSNALVSANASRTLIDSEMRGFARGEAVWTRLTAAKKDLDSFDEVAKALLKDGQELSKVLEEPGTLQVHPDAGRSLGERASANALLKLARPTSERPRLGKARADLALAIQRQVQDQYNTILDNDRAAASRAGSIESRLSQATQQEQQKGEAWLLEEYERAVKDWEGLPPKPGSDTGEAEPWREYSDETIESLTRRYQSLETARLELELRFAVHEKTQESGVTLADLLQAYHAYTDPDLPDRNADLLSSLRTVLVNGEALDAATSVFDSFRDAASPFRPIDRDEAADWASASETEFIGLYPGVSEEELGALRAYFQGHNVDELDAELGLNSLLAEFQNRAWQQLKRVTDRKGVVFYSLDGQLNNMGNGSYSYALTRSPTSNSQFYALPARVNRPRVDRPDNNDGMPWALEDIGMDRLADEIESLLYQAMERSIEPLTINLVIAQRIMDSEMPTPLKAKVLASALAYHARKSDLTEQSERARRSNAATRPDRPVPPDLPWPIFRDAESIVTACQQRLEDLWSPKPGSSRDAQFSFERDLSRVTSLAAFATEQAQQIQGIAARVTAIRFVGIAWNATPGDITWSRTNERGLTGPPLAGPLYVVEGSGEEPKLRVVGSIAAGGSVAWGTAGTAPPDGTPLFAKIEGPSR